MDTKTNEVISGEEWQRLRRIALEAEAALRAAAAGTAPVLSVGEAEELRAVIEKEARFQELPPTLEGAARRVLQGRRAVKIARHSGGRLSKWAAGQRKAAKAKAARKRKNRQSIEKATRRKNRGRA